MGSSKSVRSSADHECLLKVLFLCGEKGPTDQLTKIDIYCIGWSRDLLSVRYVSLLVGFLGAESGLLTWAGSLLGIQQYYRILLQRYRADQAAELRVDHSHSSPRCHYVALLVPKTHTHSFNHNLHTHKLFIVTVPVTLSNFFF